MITLKDLPCCRECGCPKMSIVEFIFKQVNTDPTMKLFTVEGVDTFPVYGQSGGVTTKQIFYLRRGDMFLPAYVTDDPIASMYRAVADFDSKAHKVDLNGGDMGVPSE